MKSNRFRVSTDATPDCRYVCLVQMRVLGVWLTIKTYSTHPDPSVEDMDYARLCADKLLEHLQDHD